MKEKKCFESGHFSTDLTFHPLSSTSQPTSQFLRDSKVMRVVIDQLFQQEMRGHLSEACLNSGLYGYSVVPGQPFT